MGCVVVIRGREGINFDLSKPCFNTSEALHIKDSTRFPDTFPVKKKYTRKRNRNWSGYGILVERAKIWGSYMQEEQTMRYPNSDLDLLRSFIDLIEAERKHNSFQDKRIKEVEQQQEQLEERVSSIESLFSGLRYSMERNAELEYMENPYSLDGSPRCNY